MRTLLLSLLLLPLTALAEPVAYTLDRERSLVGFTVTMGGAPLKGNMGVRDADIILDLDDLSRSRATVIIDTASARTEQGFATEAMRGGQVLNVSRFPTIHFEATRITGTLVGGKVGGNVTIRGITRPVTLDARVFRQRGQAEGNTSKLSILMTGTIDRRDFDAGGFPGIVGPTITLEILTRLDRT